MIYLDNGPNDSASRIQFLKRMMQFANWSGLEIRLVYYPPYHSKYKPVERWRSALERKFCGVLLNCASFMLECARCMTWKSKFPEVNELPGNNYPTGVKLTRKQMQPWKVRLERSAQLPKYDIMIRTHNV